MKKDFYLIIPFDETENQSVKDTSLFWPFRNFWTTVFANWVDITKIKTQIKNFTKMKKWLAWRINGVKTSLESIWIKVKEMEKNELIKFLTDYYNPNLESFTSIKSDIENYNLIK
jgi:hypothetical protein